MRETVKLTQIESCADCGRDVLPGEWVTLAPPNGGRHFVWVCDHCMTSGRYTDWIKSYFPDWPGDRS